MLTIVTLCIFVFCLIVSGFHVNRLETENTAFRSENGVLHDELVKKSIIPQFVARRLRVLLDSLDSDAYFNKERFSGEIKELETYLSLGDFSTPTLKDREAMDRFVKKTSVKQNDNSGDSAACSDETP